MESNKDTFTEYICSRISQKQEQIGRVLGANVIPTSANNSVFSRPSGSIAQQVTQPKVKGKTAQNIPIVHEITSARFITRLKEVALFSGSTRYFGEGDDIDYFLNIDNEEHKTLWFQILEHLGIEKERFHREGELHPASDYKFVNIKAMYNSKIINVILLDTDLFKKCDRSTKRLLEMIELFPEIKPVLKNNKEFRILCFVALEEESKTKILNDLLSNFMENGK